MLHNWLTNFLPAHFHIQLQLAEVKSNPSITFSYKKTYVKFARIFHQLDVLTSRFVGFSGLSVIGHNSMVLLNMVFVF